MPEQMRKDQWCHEMQGVQVSGQIRSSVQPFVIFSSKSEWE